MPAVIVTEDGLQANEKSPVVMEEGRGVNAGLGVAVVVVTGTFAGEVAPVVGVGDAATEAVWGRVAGLGGFVTTGGNDVVVESATVGADASAAISVDSVTDVGAAAVATTREGRSPPP